MDLQPKQMGPCQKWSPFKMPTGDSCLIMCSVPHSNRKVECCLCSLIIPLERNVNSKKSDSTNYSRDKNSSNDDMAYSFSRVQASI